MAENLNRTIIRSGPGASRTRPATGLRGHITGDSHRQRALPAVVQLVPDKGHLWRKTIITEHHQHEGKR